MTKAGRYYLEARAEEEIERAQQSADPRAVASHYHLAELYLDKLYDTAQQKDSTPDVHS